MSSTHAQDLLGAREMAEVLPLAAVLAGRVLGDRLAAWIRAAKVLARPGAGPARRPGYLAALGYGAAQPVGPGPKTSRWPAWLTAHGLTDGLATYWQANSTNVDSGGQVVLSAVVQDVRDRLVPYQWETDEANVRPGLALRQLRRGGRPLRAARHAAVRASSPSAARRGYTRPTATPSWSGTRTCWPSWTTGPDQLIPADLARVAGSVTCTGCGAGPPPRARAGRRRQIMPR